MNDIWTYAIVKYNDGSLNGFCDYLPSEPGKEYQTARECDGELLFTCDTREDAIREVESLNSR